MGMAKIQSPRVKIPEWISMKLGLHNCVTDMFVRSFVIADRVQPTLDPSTETV